MAFQVRHPEVGFAPRPGLEPPWAAYWLDPGDKRRWVTGETLGEVVAKAEEEFGGDTAPPAS